MSSPDNPQPPSTPPASSGAPLANTTPLRLKPHEVQFSADKDRALQSNPQQLALWVHHVENARPVMAKAEEVDVFLEKYMGATTPPADVVAAMQQRGVVLLPRAVATAQKSERASYAPLTAYFNAIVAKLPADQRPFFDALYSTSVPILNSWEPDSRPDIIGSQPGLKEPQFRDGTKRTKRGNPKRICKWSWIGVAVEGKTKADPWSATHNITNQKAITQLLENGRRILAATGACYVPLISYFGKSARLLRVDHAGYVVSQSFDWSERTDIFPKFLWRVYCGASKGYILGADETISPLTDVDRAWLGDRLSTVPDYTGTASEDVDRSVCITVGDKRCFTVGQPIFASHGLFSRATCVRKVLVEDDAEPRFRVLKDSWCQVCRIPEYVFYRIIEHYIQQHPELRLDHLGLTACMAYEDFGHARVSDSAQVDDGHLTVAARCRARHNTYRHERRHQRILLEDFGMLLSEYPTTRDLFQGVRDAIYGHYIAYLAGIIHRDVSFGNVLLMKDANGAVRGFLHDWDVALLTPHGRAVFQLLFKDVLDLADFDIDKTTKEITGTFPFLAIEAISAYQKARDKAAPTPYAFSHQNKHDLESFFWLLLWVLAHNCRNHIQYPSQLDPVIVEQVSPHGQSKGGWLFMNVLSFTGNEHERLSAGVRSLQLLFRQAIRDQANPPSNTNPILADIEHQDVLRLMEPHLERDHATEWPNDPPEPWKPISFSQEAARRSISDVIFSETNAEDSDDLFWTEEGHDRVISPLPRRTQSSGSSAMMLMPITEDEDENDADAGTKIEAEDNDEYEEDDEGEYEEEDEETKEMRRAIAARQAEINARAAEEQARAKAEQARAKAEQARVAEERAQLQAELDALPKKKKRKLSADSQK
ncbi:DAD domain-containing protein [Mycena kentingensis (nom. inval.)]|nr:DAD domain-containing protein [Mycena kentingensis (nom. inval.)]